VLLEKSPELVITALAIVKAGGVYLPVDPTYPEDRLSFILGDCDPKLVIREPVTDLSGQRDDNPTDADRVRRWSGGDVDLSRRLPSDLIVAAAGADDALADLVGPYTTMDALPASLAPAQPRARDIYAGGWRPPVPDGPTRAELSEVVSRTPAAA